MVPTATTRRPEHPAEKVADTAHPVSDDIRERWSPRAFADRSVGEEQLRSLLEAARWAPSSYNEQPWRFIVARREDPEAFERLLDCLNEGNREWASGAPVLMLTAARERFTRNDRPNRHAYHDVGLAMGNLIHQAGEMDLYVHQMAGIQPDHAREVFDVPEDFDIVAGVAIGFLGDPQKLDDEGRRSSEIEERTRKPLDELVFEESWGQTATFL